MNAQHPCPQVLHSQTTQRHHPCPLVALWSTPEARLADFMDWMSMMESVIFGKVNGGKRYMKPGWTQHFPEIDPQTPAFGRWTVKKDDEIITTVDGDANLASISCAGFESPLDLGGGFIGTTSPKTFLQGSRWKKNKHVSKPHEWNDHNHTSFINNQQIENIWKSLEKISETNFSPRKGATFQGLVTSSPKLPTLVAWAILPEGTDVSDLNR